MIKDNYKLIRSMNDQSGKLYNLTNDPREATDISSEQPEKVTELTAYLARFFTQW